MLSAKRFGTHISVVALAGETRSNRCYFRHLTTLEPVCYVAPTLRRMRDLTSGPHGALAKAQAQARPRSLVALGLGALVACAACGPVGYLNQVHRRAREAVVEARRAGAEQAAPYELTAAVEYLSKAEEEGGEAEYQVAIEYGRRSEDFAHRALAAARRAPPPGAATEPPGRRGRE